MAHPFPGFRFCIALALVSALQAQSAFQPRLAAMAAVMDRYYRGESLEAAQRRVNAMVDSFNARVEQRNGEMDAARARLDQDRSVGPPPAATDEQGIRRFNERVKAHNAAVAAFNERVRTLDAGIERARARMDAEEQALKARSQSFQAFQDQGRDVAFYTAVNQLLAELREACRSRPDPDLLAALGQVRGCRRELARWAGEREEAQDNGLVLVDAVVGDEPCCFIVDTGAQRVCLPAELIRALGLTGSLGEETTMTLAGGQKLRGRTIVLPRVAVGDKVATEVAGSAVPASEVGIDGLLGQTFLKHFVYTIDEARPGKLILVPRK
jgi:clan AA aspartic protease (TIGR02281 family)